MNDLAWQMAGKSSRAICRRPRSAWSDRPPPATGRAAAWRQASLDTEQGRACLETSLNSLTIILCGKIHKMKVRLLAYAARNVHYDPW